MHYFISFNLKNNVISIYCLTIYDNEAQIQNIFMLIVIEQTNYPQNGGDGDSLESSNKRDRIRVSI